MNDMEECENGSWTWEEETYWKHFHTIHFYHILPKHLHHHLVLPAKFAERMSSTLPRKVSLIGPNGYAWDVEVSKTDSICFGGDGWKGFAEMYGLEERSLLLFKYKLNSSFEVLIFDKESLCEKEAAYFAKKSLEKKPDQINEMKRKTIDLSSTEILEDFDDDGGGESEFVSSKKPDEDNFDEVPKIPSDERPEDDCNDPDFILPIPSVSKEDAAQGGKTVIPRRSLATFSPQSAKKQNPDLVAEGATMGTPNKCDVSHVSPNNGVSSQSIARRRDSRPKKRCRKAALDRVLTKKNPTDNYTSNRRPVTASEKRVAYNRAMKRMTEKSFVAVMWRTCVYKTFRMDIPSAWTQKHLLHGYHEVTLRVGEKTWTVTFSWYESRHSGDFSIGWKNFALENNLEEDVCVFTLISQKDEATLIFDVEIFRVVEEILPLSINF